MATSLRSKAFFAGGATGVLTITPIIDIYDAASNQWATASLFVARQSLAAAASGNLVFFAGGINVQNQASNVADIYNITTNQWTVTKLTTIKGALSAVSVGNKVLFTGDGSSNVDIYTVDAVLLVNLAFFSGKWTEQTADVSGLPSGAYVMDVLTTNGQHLRSRFVKQ